MRDEANELSVLSKRKSVPEIAVPGENTPFKATVISETDAAKLAKELDTEIEVGDLIDTIEYDYPTFHLSMQCFWAEVVSGHLELKEAEDARWLTADTIDSVEWLPADRALLDKIKKSLSV